jgi:DNA-binding response OmpR family regulator
MNRIMIVEDEPRIIAFLEKGLQSSGFVTTAVTDGKTAVSIALNNEFDLIILDLGLPDKDGLTVLQELRGQGVPIPIILLTARDDITDKILGLDQGADDYITKPFRFEELLARVRARLRNIVAFPPQADTALSRYMRYIR